MKHFTKPGYVFTIAAVICVSSCISSARKSRVGDAWRYPPRLQIALSRESLNDRRVLLEQLLSDYDPNVRVSAAEHLALIKQNIQSMP